MRQAAFVKELHIATIAICERIAAFFARPSRIISRGACCKLVLISKGVASSSRPALHHSDLTGLNLVMRMQNEERLGYLRNDGNDFLNYTDDWYILGWKEDAYAVIYYKGNNDAWKGYGGATVYTR